MNAVWGLLYSGPSFRFPCAILGCCIMSCSVLVMYFGFAQPFFINGISQGFPFVAALSPLGHPPHSSMGCACSLQQARTVLLSHVAFRKAVCKRRAGNWCCTSWEGRWLSPHLHQQWKGFAMTTSLMCTVNLQLFRSLFLNLSKEICLLCSFAVCLIFI